MGTDRAVHGRKHEIPVFVKNPVAFTVFPVYREELQFSGIFPDNPVGLACMVWCVMERYALAIENRNSAQH